jgi:hypothetical protein
MKQIDERLWKNQCKPTERVAAMMEATAGPLATQTDNKLKDGWIKTLHIQPGSNNHNEAIAFLKAIDKLKSHYSNTFDVWRLIYFATFQSLSPESARPLWDKWTAYMVKHGTIIKVKGIEPHLYQWTKQ